MASGQFPQNPNPNPNPFAGNPNAPQPKPKSNTTMVIVLILGVLAVGMVVCGGILVALLLPAIGAARTAAQRMQRANNVKMVGLGLHNYHSAFKQLPAAVSAKSTGEEVHGWRLSLAPFVESQDAFERFDQEQPWHSPANQSVTEQLTVFQTLEGEPGQTNIFAIVSDNGMFVPTPNQGIKFRETLDGLANTILAIELPNRSVEWTSTENLTPDEAYNAIMSLEGMEAAHLLMGDGAVIAVRNDLDRDTFDAMVTRDGKEQVFLPDSY